MLNVILPMAGYGRRFREAGYEQEKPLIEAGGRTLLGWSLLPITPLFDWPAGKEGRLVFVLRQGKDVGYLVEEEYGQAIYDTSPFFSGVTRSVQLCGPTQGAACTVLAAAVGLPPDAPVLVLNADQWFKLDWEKTLTQAAEEKWDGFILTFPGTGPAWSYAVTNGTDRVVWVVEKKPVSPHATCGIYWWRRASDLVHSICAMVASGQRTNNEFYLAPSMNFLPLADKDVRIVPVDEFHGLGTPEQVREFEELIASGWRP